MTWANAQPLPPAECAQTKIALNQNVSGALAAIVAGNVEAATTRY